jgi:hypothetical protein
MSYGLTESKIMQTLDWAYDKAINGVAGLDSAIELADDYMKQQGSKIDQANSLIRWQNTKAGTQGFRTRLSFLICHNAERIMVNIQRLMLSSCKLQRNRVYSRLLGDGNDGDEWRMSDGVFERTERSAPTEQRDVA